MDKQIQIALLRSNYQQIINVDRSNPSDEMVVVVTNSDSAKDSTYYKNLETSLGKLKEYCEIVQVKNLGVRVVDLFTKTSIYEIISDCVDIIHEVHKPEYNLLLSLGDSSPLLNIAFLYAGNLVKGLHGIDLAFNISEAIGDKEVIFSHSEVISLSLSALTSTTIDPHILHCVEKNYKIEKIAEELDKTAGTISNWLHSLEERRLIEIKGRERTLTKLGYLIKRVMEIKNEVENK